MIIVLYPTPDFHFLFVVISLTQVCKYPGVTVPIFGGKSRFLAGKRGERRDDDDREVPYDSIGL